MNWTGWRNACVIKPVPCSSSNFSIPSNEKVTSARVIGVKISTSLGQNVFLHLFSGTVCFSFGLFSNKEVQIEKKSIWAEVRCDWSLNISPDIRLFRSFVVHHQLLFTHVEEANEHITTMKRLYGARYTAARGDMLWILPVPSKIFKRIHHSNLNENGNGMILGLPLAHHANSPRMLPIFIQTIT